MNDKSNIIKVACYSRVSTREQVEGLSLDVQRESMEKFVECQKTSGWALYRHYCDAGESGTTLDRPEFQKMLEDAREGKFDVVLVHKLDRVSRGLYNLMTLIYKELEPIGIAFKLVSEPMIDTLTPAGKLMFQQLGSIAEFEVNRILERTQEGKRRTAELGLFNGGLIPYGYKVENKRLVPVEDEAKVVKWIYEQYATGKRGMRSICNELNQQGILTHQGKRWNPGTLAYVLENPVYTGSVVYYKCKGWKKDHPSRPNPKHKWLHAGNAHESIINAELWSQVQKVISRRKTNGNPNRIFHNEYLLSGILYCGQCGALMWGRYNRSRNYRMYTYVCQNHSTVTSLCPQQSIKCHEIDNEIFTLLKRIISIPGFIEQIQKDLIELSAQKNPDLIQELESLTTSVQEIDNQLIRARELCVKGILTDDEYTADSHRLKQQKDSLLQEIEDKQRKAATAEWNFLKYQEVGQILVDFDATINNLTKEQKKDFVLSIIDCIQVVNNEITQFRLKDPFMKWVAEINDKSA